MAWEEEEQLARPFELFSTMLGKSRETGLVSTCWSAEQIQQNDVLFLNTMLFQNLDRLYNSVASRKNRIEQQDSSLFDVHRKLGVQNSRLVCDLITLNQNLSDTY